jgi:hypothetical protein
MKETAPTIVESKKKKEREKAQGKKEKKKTTANAEKNVQPTFYQTRRRIRAAQIDDWKLNEIDIIECVTCSQEVGTCENGANTRREVAGFGGEVRGRIGLERCTGGCRCRATGIGVGCGLGRSHNHDTCHGGWGAVDCGCSPRGGEAGALRSSGGRSGGGSVFSRSGGCCVTGS